MHDFFAGTIVPNEFFSLTSWIIAAFHELQQLWNRSRTLRISAAQPQDLRGWVEWHTPSRMAWHPTDKHAIILCGRSSWCIREVMNGNKRELVAYFIDVTLLLLIFFPYSAQLFRDVRCRFGFLSLSWSIALYFAPFLGNLRTICKLIPLHKHAWKACVK